MRFCKMAASAAIVAALVISGIATAKPGDADTSRDVNTQAPVSAYTLSDFEKQVPLVYRHVGVQNGVPYRLLYAVALAESGLVSPTNGAYRPWPWTLNVGGKPERFESQDEAYQRLVDLIDHGKRNIDIGLAQINYKYNGHLIPSIEQGLDPLTNLSTATRVLMRELEVCGFVDWWCAVGRYHSPGTSLAQTQRRIRYTERVRALWDQLI